MFGLVLAVAAAVASSYAPAASAPLRIAAPAPVMMTDPIRPSAPAMPESLWRVTFRKGTTPPPQSIAVTIRNPSRASTSWMPSNVPAWVALPPLPNVGGKLLLGQEFIHGLAPGQSQTIQVALVPSIAAQYPVGTFRDEIALFCPSSDAKEVYVRCELVVAP